MEMSLSAVILALSFYRPNSHKTCNMKLMIKYNSHTVEVLFLTWFDVRSCTEQTPPALFELRHRAHSSGATTGKSLFSDPGRGSGSGMQQWLRKQTT